MYELNYFSHFTDALTFPSTVVHSHQAHYYRPTNVLESSGTEEDLADFILFIYFFTTLQFIIRPFQKLHFVLYIQI